MAKMKVVQAPNPGGGCKPRNSKIKKRWNCFVRRLNRRSSRRRNHGNCNDHNPPPFASVHARECDSKGAPRRGQLEYSRPGESSSGLRDRFTMEEPLGVRQRTK